MEPAVYDTLSLTCLVGAAGSFLACREEGAVVMVVARSTYNFLAWRASVVGEADSGRLQLEPNQEHGSLCWYAAGDWVPGCQSQPTQSSKTDLDPSFFSRLLKPRSYPLPGSLRVCHSPSTSA